MDIMDMSLDEIIQSSRELRNFHGIMDMSLDEIIQSSRELRNFHGGRGGRGSSRINETGGVGKMRGGLGTMRRSSGFRYARSLFLGPPGDINSQWQHDLYDGPRPAAPTAFSRVPTKLLISNLHYAVSDADIQELYGEFGPLISSGVNYDRSGRSLGSAYVVYERSADAVRAMEQNNGVPLDGMPMRIELTTSDFVPELNPGRGRGFRGGFGPGSSRGSVRGGGDSLRGGGGYRGHGRGRGGRGHGGRGRGGRDGRGLGRGCGGREEEKPALTKTEMDEQLFAYVNSMYEY